MLSRLTELNLWDFRGLDINEGAHRPLDLVQVRHQCFGGGGSRSVGEGGEESRGRDSSSMCFIVAFAFTLHVCKMDVDVVR